MEGETTELLSVCTEHNDGYVILIFVVFFFFAAYKLKIYIEFPVSDRKEFKRMGIDTTAKPSIHAK